MRRSRGLRWPSPAMIVACIALAVALSGASYAAIVLPKNSVGTKQLRSNAVKSTKIAPNQVKGVDVDEASLGTVPAAASAGTSDLFDGLDSSGFWKKSEVVDEATPFAYGLVRADGTLIADRSKNISASSKALDVTQLPAPVPYAGVYCISLASGATARSASATGQFGISLSTLEDADTIVNVDISSITNSCPAGTDAIVTTWDASDAAREDHSFFVWFLR